MVSNFILQVSVRLFMLNFSIGVYFFQLISSLVTENFSVGVVYTCFCEQYNNPTSSEGAYSVPRTPQLREVMFVRLAVHLPKNPIPALSPAFFTRRSSSQIRLTVVYHLSSVTLFHPVQRVEFFSNIFAPSNSIMTSEVCNKILKKN